MKWSLTCYLEVVFSLIIACGAQYVCQQCLSFQGLFGSIFSCMQFLCCGMEAFISDESYASVRGYTESWDVPDHFDNALVVKQYLGDALAGYLCYSFMVPLGGIGERGMIAMVSTPASSRCRHGGSLDVEWLYFDVYYEVNAVFGDWYGMRNAVYQCTMLEFLQRRLASASQLPLLSRYTGVVGTSRFDGLRLLISEVLSAPVWAEFITGHSLRWYRGLDCYIQFRSPGGIIGAPGHAWYILYDGKPYQHRVLFRPDQWMRCVVSWSYGVADMSSFDAVDTDPSVALANFLSQTHI